MAEWDGVERRQENRGIGFCSSHTQLATDMAVIKNSLSNIESSIVSGVSFRRGMVGSVIGVAVVVVIQIIGFSFLYGGLVTQVRINTDTINTRLVSKDTLSEFKNTQAKINEEMGMIKEQIYDLNFEKGKTQGLSIKR